MAAGARGNWSLTSHRHIRSLEAEDRQEVALGNLIPRGLLSVPPGSITSSGTKYKYTFHIQRAAFPQGNLSLLQFKSCQVLAFSSSLPAQW